MIQRDYLIVGGGVGGASVCDSLRQYDPKGSVTLVSNEPHLPYQRPPLSKGFLKEAGVTLDTMIEKPEDWYKKRGIEVRLGTYVREFNIERHLAVLENGQTIEFRKACLATGSRARRPQVAGANLGNVVYLRSFRDALAIREILLSEKHVVVVGSGYIGAEVSSSLANSGAKLSLLSRDKVIWQELLDPDTAQWLTDSYVEAGIQLLLNENLNGFEGKTVIKNIQTKSGMRFPAGLAVVAIGTEPNLQLVANTPLSSPSGCPVNEYLETDEKGIYAVGDIALYPDRIYGGAKRIANVEMARLQGLTAGANLSGRKRQKFECVPAWSSQVLGMHFDFVGDFSMPHLMADIQGSREKRNFVARYRRGETLIAAVLCNREPTELATVQEEVKTSVLSRSKR
ncbi:MAG: 3-phenylpropionate/trans-cinnamate dioxygenase ferredoxin reductase component [Verrucomicrobiota bacterium]|jgi:3-phenylpropionate/trans-cinnamate dioxygenase ferredoxin reductase subunit|nr:3-phenylpropionate/trans-cinnamate dioxygenase ferredoxin reductase component [Verrucomicrobiota bacterium]